MKYIFIVNEKAGRGKYKELIPNIESSCKKRNLEYEISKFMLDYKEDKTMKLKAIFYAFSQ